MNRPEPAAGLRAGDLLARRYLLMEPIGRGGMSVIWRAFDQSLERMVAIKILDGDLGADREIIRREARATARLIHPDAIEIYDYGETVTAHGRLAAYVVMRLLEGRSLADRIDESPLPWEEAVVVAGRLAAVLGTAHERGIVHRDVTAENVLLTADGAKLLDFGIAAFIGEQDDRTGEYGTPPYVAPERLTGTAADPAGDVYALGVLLFEMLTGDTPYPERTWEEIESARRDGPPPALLVPGLPPEVAALCRRCLSHAPWDRPGAREAADVLADALPALPDAPAGRARARTARLRPDHAAGSSVRHEPAPRGSGRPESSTGILERPETARAPAAPATRGGNPFWTAAAAVMTLAAAGLFWVQAAGVPGRSGEPSGSAIGATSRPSPTEPSPAGSPSPVPEAGPRTAPADGPVDGPAREPAREATGKPTAPMVMVEDARRPTLHQSVQGFNALLARGAKTGAIRADVALDLRQVLAGSVCCTRDLTPIRGKIADRYREGSIPGALREALDDQLEVVARALAG